MTDDELVLEVVVDREHVITAEGSFRRILHGRARERPDRFDESAWGARRIGFRVIQVLAPVACLGSIVVAARLLPRGDAPLHALLWMISAVVFGGLSAWFLSVGWRGSEERIDAWYGRIADRAARRIVRNTLEITPFRVTYTVSGDTWRTVVDDPHVEVEFRRDAIGEVRSDAHVVCLYRSHRSIRWTAVVWAVTDDVRQAIDAFTG